MTRAITLALIAGVFACGDADNSPTSSEVGEQYAAAMAPLLGRADAVITDLQELLQFSAIEGVEELLETQYSRVHSGLLLTEVQLIRAEAEPLSAGTPFEEARDTFLLMMTTLETALSHMHSSYLAADAEGRASALQQAEAGSVEVSRLRQELGDVHGLHPEHPPDN
jgi:hypothetical protein